jgi:hypothetical protein
MGLNVGMGCETTENDFATPLLRQGDSVGDVLAQQAFGKWSNLANTNDIIIISSTRSKQD